MPSKQLRSKERRKVCTSVAAESVGGGVRVRGGVSRGESGASTAVSRERLLSVQPRGHEPVSGSRYRRRGGGGGWLKTDRQTDRQADRQTDRQADRQTDRGGRQGSVVIKCLSLSLVCIMLYFQLVIMAGTVMLAYYFEYTDTFSVHVQGFFCYDTAFTKPYLGPEDSSAVPPVLLYAVVAGLPTLLITITETVLFLVQYTSKEFDRSEKTVAIGDCCYLNPLVRRTFRFLGVYIFGLFTVDIFVNAGQVVTGNLAPYFLTVCKPNYTALGCQQALRYISHQEACTGNQDDILRARKTFPSKEAALSVYGALYLAMYVTCVVQAKGTRLAKPVLSLGLMCLAFLTGLNRVAEYRNHWSDVIAGFIIGSSIATFLVVCVVHNFKGKLLLSEESPAESRSNTAMLSMGRVESPLEKYIASQNHITFAEVT